MTTRDKNVSVTFTNYNYAINTFYENYKDQCISLSKKTNILDLPDIGKIISTFIYEYDYSIMDQNQRNKYRQELGSIKEEINQDDDMKRILNRDQEIIKTRIEHNEKYYKYYLRYLELLGTFISELTNSYMPNTNIQKKLIRFSNNQAFFQKFTEHKKEVLNSLSEYSLRNFKSAYNTLITFYYSYILFVNMDTRSALDNLFSLILSAYLNKQTQYLISNELTQSQYEKYKLIEVRIHNSLLYCNSRMNESFSNYDVLPKLEKKVYVDRSLI